MEAFVNCIQNREDEWEGEEKGEEGGEQERRGEKREERGQGREREDRSPFILPSPTLLCSLLTPYIVHPHTTTRPHTMHSPSTNQQS